MSLIMAVESQTWKEGSLTLSNFLSLSCLMWSLSVSLFSTNGKYKTCGFVWAVNLSSSFFVKRKQRKLEVFFVSSEHINVLWASILRESVS